MSNILHALLDASDHDLDELRVRADQLAGELAVVTLAIEYVERRLRLDAQPDEPAAAPEAATPVPAPVKSTAKPAAKPQPAPITELTETEQVADRVEQLLREEGPMPLAGIAARLGVKPVSIARRLTNQSVAHRFTSRDGQVHLAARSKS
jgi:hypothetical protein